MFVALASTSPSSFALCLFGSACVFELVSPHVAMLFILIFNFSVVLISLLQCISGIPLLRVRDRSGRLLWMAFMMQLFPPPHPQCDLVSYLPALF